MLPRPFPWATGPILAASPEALMAAAAQAAAFLQPGDVIALAGGLGAGKTHFTKGLVAGLGCEDSVSSPTFSLAQEYRGGRLPVAHFDFYRMKSAAEVLDLGWDDYLEAGGVCIAEWADMFPQLFPERAIWLELKAIGPTLRELAAQPHPPHQ